jgi:beta-arabinofuranosyltransferase
LNVQPRPKITLVGHGAGYADVAKEFGCAIQPGLDFNFVDLPLEGSLVDVAFRATEDVSMIINSDIILTQSLPDTISKLMDNFEHWFLAGARIDLSDLPPVHEPSSPSFSDNAFSNYVRAKGILHTAGGQDYFVWNNSGKKLVEGVIPPFIRAKSKCTSIACHSWLLCNISKRTQLNSFCFFVVVLYCPPHSRCTVVVDNWFAHEVIHGGYREVVDGTEAIVAAHVLHDYASADPNVKAQATVDPKSSSTVSIQQHLY